MNPYHFYQGYVPQQPDWYTQYSYNPYFQQEPLKEEYEERQPLERRVSALERQNEEQSREITRQNEEIQRINREINRLNQNDERHTRRLNRLNQRLRAVENRLHIPFSASEDGF